MSGALIAFNAKCKAGPSPLTVVPDSTQHSTLAVTAGWLETLCLCPETTQGIHTSKSMCPPKLLKLRCHGNEWGRPWCTAFEAERDGRFKLLRAYGVHPSATISPVIGQFETSDWAV